MVALAGAGAGAGGCGGSRHPDGLDATRLPAELQADYALYANRCSRCHSLARSLGANVTNEHWVNYIARMRRMPSSGITSGDAKRILRVLFYLNAERRPPDEPTPPGDAGAPLDAGASR